MKAVVVLEFDADVVAVSDIAAWALKGVVDMVPEDEDDPALRGLGLRLHVAQAEQADWVTDVFLEPRKGGGNHYVVWGEDHWTLEHSLACRRSGDMHSCPIHQMVRVGLEAGHFIPTEPGTKLKVTLDESGALLWL